MPSDPSANAAYLVADLARLFGRVFDRRAAHLGLTRAQWRALKRVHQEEGLTQSALAELLDMEPIAVGRVLDRLQKAGFIERRADPDDRRCWRLHLLPQSRQVIGDIEDVSVGLRADAAAGIDPESYATALRVLAQMRENLARLDRESRANIPARNT